MGEGINENGSHKITPVATNGEIFPWNNVRLPSFIRPIRYHINIHPNLTTLDVKGMFTLVIFCNILNIVY